MDLCRCQHHQARNPDEGFRSIERKHVIENTLESRAMVLINRVRRGETTYQNLSVAGWLGDEAAKIVVPVWAPPIPPSNWFASARGAYEEWPARFALEHGPIDRISLVRAAAHIAAGVMPLFTAEFPDDNRVQLLLEAILDWANNPPDPSREGYKAFLSSTFYDYFHKLHVAVRNLSTAGPIEARQPHCAAAQAAVHAAESVHYPIFAMYTAVTAEWLFSNPKDRSRERENQRRILIAILCGDELNLFPS